MNHIALTLSLACFGAWQLLPGSAQAQTNAAGTSAAVSPTLVANSVAPGGTQSATPRAAEAIEVIGITPVPGVGVPRSRMPENVRLLKSGELDENQPLNLPDFFSRRLPSVNINETQGNALQPSLNYRGFMASPLLGAPQGLSVYLDGARVNESFGDLINWDLIPRNALASVAVLPGSNPLFGLNTLGGALSLRTKSGDSHPGTRAQAAAGSFGREDWQLEHGASHGDASVFLAVSRFRERGWRDQSPSSADQLFGKFTHHDAQHSLEISLAHGNTDLTGNGLVPQSMQAQSYRRVYTVPDNTRNLASTVIGNFAWRLSDQSRILANAYHRRVRTRTLNGDVNTGFENDAALDGSTGANGNLGFNQDTAVNNRTRTQQYASGASLQWTLSTAAHQLAVGASHDRGNSDFEQTADLGIFTPERAVIENNPGAASPRNQLQGLSRVHALFVSETYALTPALNLSASARYNHARVATRDLRRTAPPNLNGDYTYKKLNPALGITWDAAPQLNIYGGWNQGNRAPTPIELGCADRANPCTLPNSLASDPFLKQVVARTFESGVRGRFGERLRWNAGLYRTDSSDDIIFVGTTASAGYFTNVGKTRRQGAELGIGGHQPRWDWDAGYSYLLATYESSACLLSQNNSQRGQDAECASPGDDLIRVARGNRMTGLPSHTLKAAISARVNEATLLGADVAMFSRQFLRGNENNAHQAGNATVNGNTRTFLGSGSTAGYAILNMNGQLDLGGGWSAIARVNNVFNKRYHTGGMLAENAFSASGVFQTNSDLWTRESFVAPGVPRAAWLGVRYRFDARREASALNRGES